MNPLTLQMEVLTPLFLGGAEPNDRAELRAPSVKGALRFWHRAINPDYRDLEPEAFGSAQGGQSPFALVLPHLDGTTQWDVRQLRLKHPGLAYLGYSLDLGENKRKYLLPAQPVELRLLPRRQIAPGQRRAWVAALWLWSAFGGLGSRGGRGFGSVVLAWPSSPVSGWPELQELRLRPVQSAQQWADDACHNLKVLRGWFGLWAGNQPHPHVGPGFQAAVGAAGFSGWEQALDAAGQVMVSQFRGGLGRRKSPPDYNTVKAHLVYHGARPKSGTTAPPGTPLTAAPERAGFGLPLTFRYRSLEDGPPEVTFTPVGSDRWPSPLHLGMASIGGRRHPVYCLLDMPCPAQVVASTGETLPGPGPAVLQQFMNYVSDPRRGVPV